MKNRRPPTLSRSIPTRREGMLIDALISRLRSRANGTEFAGRRLKPRDDELRFLSALERIAMDRGLCKKIETQTIRDAKSLVRKTPYDVVRVAVGAEHEFSKTPKRNPTEHRAHYETLVELCRELARKLVAEDRFGGLGIELSALRWLDKRYLGAAVKQAIIGQGVAVGEDIDRALKLLAVSLSVGPPSIPYILNQLAKQYLRKLSEGTETSRPLRAKRTYVLRKMIEHVRAHHDCSNPSPSLIAEVASVVLNEDVPPAQVSRMIRTQVARNERDM